MKVKDMMRPDGRVFLKSSFGLIDDRWPCFSFSKMSVAAQLQAEFVPGRDIFLYVGTTDPLHTEDPDHRSRIVSAVTVQPGQILESRKIVPEDAWADSVRKHGGRGWEHAMALIDAAAVEGPPYPEARKVVPKAYAALGDLRNFGGYVEAITEERSAAMELNVRRIELRYSERVLRYMHVTGAASVDKAVKQAAFRMANLIEQRVRQGGQTGSRTNPVRSAPNQSDLIAMLTRKWTVDQDGKCALCGGEIWVPTENRLLQPSPDRIDIANGWYDEANLQVTHLACNLAKNDCDAAAFEEWMTVVRGAQPTEPPAEQTDAT